jgi:subtilisin-like proprotein convertase family protein
MHWRTRIWFFLSLSFLVLIGYIVDRGHQPGQNSSSMSRSPLERQDRGASSPPLLSTALLNQPAGQLTVVPRPQGVIKESTTQTNRGPHRLTNSPRKPEDLRQSDTAIVLRNALIDTANSTPVAIPENLRSQGDPGSYIAQSKGLLDDRFRAALADCGAEIISYIPNNAYLIRASREGAQKLAALPQTQAVVPYEPYFKIDGDLLSLFLDEKPLPTNGMIRLTVLPGAKAKVVEALSAMNASLVGEDRSPFGPVLLANIAEPTLAELARMPEVLVMEVRRPRVLMNDLSRVRVAVATNTTALDNYQGLTGDKIKVNVNDTGVDAGHPDLSGRVSAADPTYLNDPVGHGTFVAGTIASSGEHSDTVTNANGSVSGANYRGMAPKAKIFVLPIDLLTGPLQSDAYLQETAAKAEAFISNNSWNYGGGFDYDTAAASFDAAARDALPDEPGSTPMLFVFAAGNSGNGGANGLGGESGSVLSPSTAKNGITVGAIDSFRYITNEVVSLDVFGNYVTNYPFLDTTDSDNQVSPYSSRGNVGLGLEGESGRFKPDVVAPGSFLVSTRATGWREPETFTDASVRRFVDQVVGQGEIVNYSLYIPEGAIEVRIQIQPSRVGRAVPGLPVYMKYNGFPSTNDLVNTNNIVVLPRDFPLQSGDLFYSIGNPSTRAVLFDLQTVIVITNTPGNYFEVLRTVDDELGPYYRYDSGTSMAAPVVSGMLALMQEFFEQKLKQSYSPALLKALLINGAHSVNPIYSLAVRDAINHQGWGLPNLTNSIPTTLTTQNETSRALRFFDQSVTNALATGEQRSWKLTLSTEAAPYPLRITLVWTDPPGNPVAGVKLVNDLDLVLTNLDNGLIYYGNDIPVGADYNQPGSTNRAPDSVNNVENIFLREPLSTNWAVAVTARRVNVNAVTTHTNQIVQDYALVISCGNLTLTNPFTLNLEEQPVIPSPVNAVTNGIPLLNQRVGANSPLLGSGDGSANQWHFYVFENVTSTNNPLSLTNGTNVAFITFIPPNLARPRLAEADIDLYVSTNSALTNLDAEVLAHADKSTNRGGTELVFYTNAVIGETYYIGVKAEDQQGAEYGFVGLSTDLPFDEESNGNRIVHVLPPNLEIPDGSPQKPGGAYAFGIATRPVTVRRVVVTNIISHGDFGDLFGNLSHAGDFVVLYSHSLLGLFTSATNILIYDDSNRGDIMGSQVSDGPGSLNNFVGMSGSGLWLMTLVDSALTHTGQLVRADIFIEKAEDGLYASVLPGRFGYFYIDIPEDAIRLTININGIEVGLPLPLEVYIRREELPTRTLYDKFALIAPPGGSLTIGTNDVPPLTMGRYFIGVFNPNSVVANFYISADVKRSLDAAFLETFTSVDTPMALKDDAIVRSTVKVTADRLLTDVKVGVRIDHPRVSDLVLHLTSPQGTRLLLAESRGGATATGYGSGEIDQTNLVFAGFTENTNITTIPIKFAIPPFTTNATITTVFNSDFEGIPAGTYDRNAVVDGWLVTTNFVEVINTNIAVTGTNVLGLDLGRIARTVPTVPGRRYWLNFSFRAGDTNVLSAQVILDGKLQSWMIATNDQWQTYYLSFTAARSETLLEIEPAFRSDVMLDGFSLIEAGGIKFYLPEESLDLLKGEPSLGDWKLEIWDNRAGPGGEPLPTLLTWQLQMAFVATNYGAITLTNKIPYSGVVRGGETKFFMVNAPRAARFGTNSLSGSGDLVLLYNAEGLPVGSPTDIEVDNVVFGEEVLVLNTLSAPLLQPGQRYYLGVKNADPNTTNDFTILVAFDRYDATAPPVTRLTNGVPLTATVQSGPVMDYYKFTVSSNAAWATFDLVQMNGNADLYLKRGTPLPTSQTFQYLSSNSSTNDEQIVVLTNSFPTPLAPGDWYLGVLNLETNPVTYTIIATEYTTPIPTFIPLTNAVPYASTISNALDYYEFFVGPDSVWASFEVLNPDGNVNLVLRRGPLFPSPAVFDYQSINPGTNDELILLFTNSVPVPLTAGQWYLAVYNLETNPVNYTVVVTEYSGVMPNLITLTNGIAYTNMLEVTNLMDLYLFKVSATATQAVFEVTGANGNVDLYARKGLPWVNETNAFYASTNAGSSNEIIIVLTNSVPVSLTPGSWFLGVVNRETNAVTYQITATEYLTIPPVSQTNIIIIPWLNRSNNTLCLSWNSLIGTNYYVEGRVNITDPGWNVVSPTITATSLVTTFCISLTNANHYFQVVQGTAPSPTTNIPPYYIVVPPEILSDGSLRLTWSSVPGAVYEVQATTNWTAWTTLTHITATGTTTTYTDPTPTGGQPLRFYRVRAIGGSPPTPPPIPTLVLVTPISAGSGFAFWWSSSPGVQYEVDYSTNLINWQVLTNLVATSTQTLFTDPTPVNGLGFRFYRVIIIP